MIDWNIVGGGWVTIPGGSYEMACDENSYPGSLSLACRSESICSRSYEGTDGQKYTKMADMRVLNLMITTIVEKEVQLERIAFISCYLSSSLLTLESPKVIIFTHTFNDFAHESPNTIIILSYKTERDMILAFKMFYTAYDADVITGYGISDQIANLFDRASVLGIVDYPFFGRIPYMETKVGKKQIYNAKHVQAQRRMAQTASNRAFTTLSMTGRVLMDLLQICERDCVLLRTYSFAEAVMVILSRTKEVLTTSMLASLFKESSHTRQRAVSYAAKDIFTINELFRHMAALPTYIEMARIAGLNIQDSYTRGQGVRFWSQLGRYCKTVNVVIPSQTESQPSMFEGPINFIDEQTYHTTDSCAILDFKSLYPSIMIAHNFCYSTYSRRDSCPLVVKVVANVLKLLLDRHKSNDRQLVNDLMTQAERDECISQAVDYLKFTIRRLMAGELDLSEFLMTKGLWLGTETESYHGKQQHTELIERLKKRGTTREFREGERVSFVYIQGSQGAKAFEKTEDPAYVIENNLRIDYMHYLRHQLQNPILRILTLLGPASRFSAIFTGDHVRVTAPQTTPKVGIGSFFTRIEKSVCAGCKVEIPIGNALCPSCLPNYAGIYSGAVMEISDTLKRQTALQSVCKQCQGSSFRDVICVNWDCSVYHGRLKNEQEQHRMIPDFETLDKLLCRSLDW